MRAAKGRHYDSSSIVGERRNFCFAEILFLLYILSYRNEVPIQQKNAARGSYCGEMELCYLYDLP